MRYNEGEDANAGDDVVQVHGYFCLRLKLCLQDKATLAISV